MNCKRSFFVAFALAGLLLIGLPPYSYAQWDTAEAETEAQGGVMQDAAVQDLVGTLESRGSFTVLVSALEQSGLAAQLEAGFYTLFAPTDAAFSSVSVESLSTEALAMLLRNHLVPQALTSEELAATGSVTTVAGNKLTISGADMGELVVSDGAVTEADIQASNGIIHVVDTVMQPTASSPMAPQDTTTSFQ